MKLKICIFSYIIILLIAIKCFFLLSVFFIEKEALLTKYIFILGGILLESITLLSNRQFIHIDKLTIYIILFISYLLIRNGFIFPRILGCLYLIGFLFIYLFFKRYKLLEIKINTIITLSCLSQALYGLLQYYHIVNLESHFSIIGSYDNPAGFAAGLAITFPICLSLFDLTKLQRLIAIFSILIITTAIILSESRAGIISIIVVTIIYAYNRLPKKFIKFKKYLIPTIFLLGIIIFIILLILKKDSALGRLLIWQITLEMIKDNLFFGGGNGTFLANYMEYQANFFIHNPNNQCTLLADNVLHPFNEFLLILVEYGTITFVLLISIIITMFRSHKLCSPYILCLLSLGIFSLFSYPFKYPFTWLIVAYCFAQTNKTHETYLIITLFWKKIIKISCLIIIITGSILLIKDIRFEYQWNRIVQESLSGKIREILPIYEDLHDSWNGNYLFLYNYGAELNRIQEYDKSIDLLKQCEQYWNDYDIQMLLADNYFNLKKWNDAELYYTKASHMCPNRFIPLYKLHEIYLYTNRKYEAMQIAQLLITKEVKIESPIINSIKTRMRKYTISN